MDYEKVYKNALKKAQEGKPIEEIFPELKKSKDKIMSEAAIQLINGCGYLYAIIDGLNIDKNDVIAWLEKQGEQKPAEWSEEDKEIMDNLLQHLKVAYSDCAWLEQTINWLKSLRPQNKWKPNDKQMEALRRMKAAIAGEGEIYGPLNSLYEDLKKIKGE